MKKSKVSVADITPTKVSPICLRIIRLWKPNVYGDKNKIKSIQMVFIDEMNSRIEGSVDQDLVNNFTNMLSEGSTIMLGDYLVVENDNDYKYANHPYKIKFQPQTKVKSIVNFNGSIYGFNFVSFGDVLAGKVSGNHIVDIIGYIVNVGEIIQGEFKGKPNKRRLITLEDLQGQTIECTLWDAFVDEFSSFIKNNEDETNVIIMIMQFSKIREWNERYSVGNAFFGTKLFINTELSEINNFKSMLKEKNGPKEESIFNIGSISTKVANSGPEAFWANKTCVTLEQISQISKETNCVTLATIKNVCTDKPWFYIACRKCTRKVNPSSAAKADSKLKKANNTWICRNCGSDITDVFPRYKLEVIVVDQTGSTTFVLFEKEVMKFISSSAYHIRGRIIDEQQAFPEELDALNGMTLMFEFKVTNFNLETNHKVYTVSKVSNDESVVEAFLKLAEANDKPSSSKMVRDCHITKTLLKENPTSSDDSDGSLEKKVSAETKQMNSNSGSLSSFKPSLKRKKGNPKIFPDEVEGGCSISKSKGTPAKKIIQKKKK